MHRHCPKSSIFASGPQSAFKANHQNIYPSIFYNHITSLEGAGGGEGINNRVMSENNANKYLTHTQLSGTLSVCNLANLRQQFQNHLGQLCCLTRNSPRDIKTLLQVKPQ